MDAFLVRAALAGVGVALAAGPLGCFVVWRRMAYFGDAVAHAGILGVALAFASGMPVMAGAMLSALAMAVLVFGLSGRALAADTILGVLAHSALAFGLLSVAILGGPSVDLTAFLFGDILAVNATDLVVIWLGALAVIGGLTARWRALLTATLDPDLAVSCGIDPRRESLLLTLGMAVVVAVAIKVVGVLLIAALMIIPAASARAFSSTPERMAVSAALLGIASALGGLALSFFADTPTGPSIVAVAALGFVAASIAGARFSDR